MFGHLRVLQQSVDLPLRASNQLLKSKVRLWLYTMAALGTQALSLQDFGALPPREVRVDRASCLATTRVV
jgi:hypothetical protein